MMTIITAALPLVLKVLGWMFNRAIEKGTLKKEQAERYLKDVQAIAKQLGTAAKLRDEAQSQMDELDQYEHELDNPKPPEENKPQ